MTIHNIGWQSVGFMFKASVSLSSAFLRHCLQESKGVLFGRESEAGEDPDWIWLQGHRVVTCQSQGDHSLEYALLLYGLFLSEWEHNLLNEHHVVLMEAWN